MAKTTEIAQLTRIADALERISPPPPAAPDFKNDSAFIWNATPVGLIPIAKVNRVDVSLLQGVDSSRYTLMENTRRFASGLPANNALLWGARGMGKSSLVKAVHREISTETKSVLKIVEIHREDIESLPALMSLVRKKRKI